MTTTTVKEAGNQLDLVNDILGKFTKSTKDLLELQHKEIKGDHETALAAVNKKLDEIAPSIAALQQKQKDLTDIVADLETGPKRRPDNTSDIKLATQSIGYKVTRDPAYALFTRASQRNQMAKVTVAVACMFAGIKRVPKDLVDKIVEAAKEGKAIDFDDTTAGTGVNPQYIPGVVEFPKVMPLIRQLCPALATSETNLIRIDREKQELPLVAKVTTLANTSATSIIVDNVSGFQTATGWNTIYLDNGSDPIETNAVSAITPNSNGDGGGTLTVTATGIAMAVGTRVYAQRWGVTAEGALAPRSAEELEDYEVPICEISSLVRANALKLDDIAYAEQYIERRLLNRLARMEDLHSFYGPGGSGKIKGIFADTAVDESTRVSGTSYIDHILDCIYEVWDRDYNPSATVLSLAVHKALTKSKDSTGRYLFWQNVEGGSPMQIHVTRLFGHRQLNATHGVVGDFQMAATLFDREESTVEIGYNNDDFARRKKSILAHERIAFAIEQPGALQRAVF